MLFAYAASNVSRRHASWDAGESYVASDHQLRTCPGTLETWGTSLNAPQFPWIHGTTARGHLRRRCFPLMQDAPALLLRLIETAGCSSCAARSWRGARTSCTLWKLLPSTPEGRAAVLNAQIHRQALQNIRGRSRPRPPSIYSDICARRW